MTYTFQRSVSLALQNRVVSALIHASAAGRGPLSSDELAVEVFRNVRHLRRLLAFMVSQTREYRRIRISHWRRNGHGEPSPLYAVGQGPNAPCPVPYTPSELNKRYRRNNPELALQSTLDRRVTRLRIRRDSLTVGLFGSAT